MIMPSRLRKVALTAHLASSVGWLGAAACFLALAVVGLASQDAQTARATSLVLAPAAWSVLVPLSLGSLLTRAGLVPGYHVGLGAARLGADQAADYRGSPVPVTRTDGSLQLRRCPASSPRGPDP